MSRFVKVGAAAVVALCAAGCSTTVAGTAVVDPSAVAAQLEVGSNVRTPHNVSALNSKSGRILEASRLSDTIPKLTDLDPDFRYNGKGYLGTPAMVALSMTLSSAVANAVGTFELAATFSADNSKPGTVSTGKGEKSISVAVVRLADADAASKAASSADFAKPDTAETTKSPVKIDGFPEANAYSTEWKSLGTWSYTAMLPVGEYVVAAYVSMPSSTTAQKVLTEFLDKQKKALASFKTTPLSQLTAQQPDPFGVVPLTLPDKTGETWSTANRAAQRTDDVNFFDKLYSDAGVDYIGYGTNDVYRTRDQKSAEGLADGAIQWWKTTYPKGKVSQSEGVAPGAKCWTYPEYEGSKSTKSVCYLARGRYVAVISDSQTVKVIQATNAAYFVLEGAK